MITISALVFIITFGSFALLTRVMFWSFASKEMNEIIDGIVLYENIDREYSLKITKFIERIPLAKNRFFRKRITDLVSLSYTVAASCSIGFIIGYLLLLFGLFILSLIGAIPVGLYFMLV